MKLQDAIEKYPQRAEKVKLLPVVPVDYSDGTDWYSFHIVKRVLDRNDMGRLLMDSDFKHVKTLSWGMEIVFSN